MNLNVYDELLRKEAKLAVIGLGSNIFYGTQLAACVLVFRMKKSEQKIGKVLFIEASSQIRVGRAQNFLEPEHVKQIYDWFTGYKDVPDHVKVVDVEDILEKDFNLNIPLYIEKTIADDLPSVEEALADLKIAWTASTEAEEKFKNILKQFI
ncbi:MAG: hypothetical protein EOO43_18350 [Flavobacterium sp.]|nr:MAG: hypothetical protein EOO43_18350 [Flavobacterium sp.]